MKSVRQSAWRVMFACIALTLHCASAGRPATGGEKASAPPAGEIQKQHALPTLLEQCDRGTVQACDDLCVADSKREVADDPHAAVWCGRACDAGLGPGCVGLGLLHVKDQGAVVQPDLILARELFARGCNAHFATGCENLGVMLLQGRGGPKQVAAGLQLLEQTCHDGDQAGCSDLAVAYLKGDLLPLDCSRLNALAETACDHREGGACAALSAMYLDGVCVTSDLPRSSSYVIRACDANNASSCRDLGRFLEVGQGVAKDVPKAITTFEHGCRLANYESCVMAGIDLLGDGAPSDATRAVVLLDRACNHRQADGCAWEGIARRDGNGSAPDLPRARELFETACAGGSAVGCTSLLEQQLLAQELDAALPVAEHLCEKRVTPPADFNIPPFGDVSIWITGCRRVGEIVLKKSMSAHSGPDADAAKKTAYDALQKECGKGRGAACYALGLWFDGLTDTPVEAKARPFYQAACRHGFPAGCFERQRMSKGVPYSLDPHDAPAQSYDSCRTQCLKLQREGSMRQGLTIDQCAASLCSN